MDADAVCDANSSETAIQYFGARETGTAVEAVKQHEENDGGLEPYRTRLILNEARILCSSSI